MNKLSTGDKVIGISAIVYLVSMFLPWYGIDFGTGFGTSSSFNNKGTSYLLGGWLPMLLIVIVVARIAIVRFAPDTKLPDLPIPWSQATLGAAGAAAVILILRLAIGSDKVGSISTGVSLDRKFGLFIAVLSAVGVAVGAFLKYQAKEDDAGAAPSGPPTAF